MIAQNYDAGQPFVPMIAAVMGRSFGFSPRAKHWDLIVRRHWRRLLLLLEEAEWATVLEDGAEYLQNCPAPPASAIAVRPCGLAKVCPFCFGRRYAAKLGACALRLAVKAPPTKQLMAWRTRYRVPYVNGRFDTDHVCDFDAPRLRLYMGQSRRVEIANVGATDGVSFNSVEIREDTLDLVRGGFFLVNRWQASRDWPGQEFKEAVTKPKYRDVLRLLPEVCRYPAGNAVEPEVWHMVLLVFAGARMLSTFGPLLRGMFGEEDE